MAVSTSGTFRLPSLTSRQQLTAGHLPVRLVQLSSGLVLYGASMALMVESGLGVMPWDVLHQGLARYLPFSFGQTAVLVGLLVLLLWIPLRQWPGLGTIANAVVIGFVADAVLWLLPTPEGWAPRILLVVGGVVLNALATAIYIGSILGPGPRDGLMTGLHHRTGWSIRLVRTCIEVVVVAIGWLLGGTLGLGTVLYAIAIGPLTQFFLPFTVSRHLTEPLISPPMK